MKPLILLYFYQNLRLIDLILMGGGGGEMELSLKALENSELILVMRQNFQKKRVCQFNENGIKDALNRHF